MVDVVGQVVVAVGDEDLPLTRLLSVLVRRANARVVRSEPACASVNFIVLIRLPEIFPWWFAFSSFRWRAPMALPAASALARRLRLSRPYFDGDAGFGSPRLLNSAGIAEVVPAAGPEGCNGRPLPAFTSGVVTLSAPSLVASAGRRDRGYGWSTPLANLAASSLETASLASSASPPAARHLGDFDRLDDSSYTKRMSFTGR